MQQVLVQSQHRNLKQTKQNSQCSGGWPSIPRVAQIGLELTAVKHLREKMFSSRHAIATPNPTLPHSTEVFVSSLKYSEWAL